MDPVVTVVAIDRVFAALGVARQLGRIADENVILVLALDLVAAGLVTRYLGTIEVSQDQIDCGAGLDRVVAEATDDVVDLGAGREIARCV